MIRPDESKQTGSRMATKGSGSSSMACGAVHRQTPEAGARCVNRARRDLCGVSGNGYPYRDIVWWVENERLHAG